MALAPVHAQTITSDWGAPVELSRSSTFSKSPKATVDRSGTVHLFWGENNSEVQNNSGVVDAINYSSWNGRTWTDPIDVIAVEEIGQASLILLSAVSDEDGFLHLLWTKSSQKYGSGLFHSSVHLSQAANPSTWVTELVEPGTLSGGMGTLGNDDTLHIVYADNSSILYRSASQVELEWSAPSVVYQVPSNTNRAVSLPRVVVDKTGVIHVVWEEDSGEDNWNPSGVFYSRSSDGGLTWTNAQKWGESGRHGQPDIVVDGDGGVHIIWLRSIGSEDGRYYVWSGDGGLTWSEPIVLAFGSGFTGAPSLAVDGDGIAHFVNAAGTGSTQPVFHSSWDNDRWSRPTPIPESTGEGAFLVVRGGNELNVYWFDPETGDIFSSSSAIDAESVPFKSIPPLFIASNPSTVGSIAQPTAIAVVASDAQSSFAPARQFDSNVNEARTMKPPAVLAVSVLPVLVLVGVVVMIYNRRRTI